MEISAEVMQQLEAAQAEVASSETPAGPPVTAEVQLGSGDLFGFGASGSGQATQLLVDHYFTGTSKFLWAMAGGGWRHAVLTADDEQGIAQVAFSADRVDVWWNDSNKVTLLRCWKTF
jgi:hypothetical protein